MNAYEQYFVIGKVLKTHGVKGEVVIGFEGENPTKYPEFGSLFIATEAVIVPYTVVSSSPSVKQQWVVKLEGIDSLVDAEDIVGADVLLPDEWLEKEDSNDFIHNLLGYTVFDQNNKEVGLISAWYDRDPQSVLSVTSGGKEILIPYHTDFIIEKSADSKRLVMDLPDGLIDL